MHLRGVGPVAFFSGTIFALGAQKPPLTRILPSHSGERPKKRTKVFFENEPQWHRSRCFLLGHDFCLGTHSCLGAQKPPLVRILLSHLGVKTKNKTKRYLSQMHPNGVGPVAFFGGTHSRLGAQKPPLVRILPSHSGMKTKNKTKRSWSQVHPNGVGPVAFFWGDKFSLGDTKTSFGTDFDLTFGGEENKTKGLDHKCTPMVLVLLLSFGAQFSLAWGATVLAWGSRPRNDPHGTGLAWMSL